MKQIYFTAIIIALFLSLASCHGTDRSDVSRQLENAEEALALDNFKRSSEICNSLITSKDTVNFTASDYFSLATIYAVLADNDVDNDVSMAQAAHCLNKAMEISPDSTVAYLSRLPAETQSMLTTVQQILNGRGADMSKFIDPEDPSSISDHDIDPEAETTDHSHE